MGLPLSGVVACLSLEFLESGPFRFIIPRASNYSCYTDHILLIYPWNNDLNITDRLNDIEFTIEFTYELKNNTLA